jgi:hypothetical protein
MIIRFDNDEESNPPHIDNKIKYLWVPARGTLSNRATIEKIFSGGERHGEGTFKGNN